MNNILSYDEFINEDHLTKSAGNYLLTNIISLFGVSSLFAINYIVRKKNGAPLGYKVEVIYDVLMIASALSIFIEVIRNLIQKNKLDKIINSTLTKNERLFIDNLIKNDKILLDSFYNFIGMGEDIDTNTLNYLKDKFGNDLFEKIKIIRQEIFEQNAYRKVYGVFGGKNNKRKI